MQSERYYYVTFVLQDGTHAAVYVMIHAGVFLPRQVAAVIGQSVRDGDTATQMIAHVLSWQEVTRENMIADGVDDPIEVSSLPHFRSVMAPQGPAARPDDDQDED